MKRSLEKEIFWKVLIWRLGLSMPLTIIVNYFYYHSISVVLSLTIVSNIVGYIAHYLFEMYWDKIWSVVSFIEEKINFRKK
jgi:uncharacterized membrane protein